MAVGVACFGVSCCTVFIPYVCLDGFMVKLWLLSGNLLGKSCSFAQPYFLFVLCLFVFNVVSHLVSIVGLLF